MKISYKSLSIIIGLVGFLPSQANASQISAHRPQNKFYQTPLEPKKPKKNYDNTMKAVLQEEDKISKDIEIKYKN